MSCVVNLILKIVEDYFSKTKSRTFANIGVEAVCIPWEAVE